MPILHLMTKCGCQKFVVWHSAPDNYDVPIGSIGPEKMVGTPIGVDITLKYITRRFNRVERRDYGGDDVYLYMEE